MDCRQTPERNALMLSGWPTPPLSADDERRPSLAFSSFSDPSYGSSGSNYSQPSTPGHNMHSQGRPLQPLCNPGILRSSSQMPPHSLGHAVTFSNPCQNHSNQQFPASSYHCGMKTIPTSMPDGLGLHESVRLSPNSVWQDFGSSFGSVQLPSHGGGTMQHTGLQTDASFDRSHPGGPVHYSHHGSSMDSVHGLPSLEQLHQIQTGTWGDAQVVVPSQLSPDDELAYQYTTPELVDSHFSSSFDSSVSGYSGYDTIEAPSPDHAYFAPSDDEMVLVKHESFNSPTPGSGAWSRHSLPYRSSYQIPLDKTRKRSIRRRRKTSVHGERYKASLPGPGSSRRDLIEVRIDPKVSFDDDGKPLLATPNAKKPHVCTKIVDGAACGRSFERSEHLKRHMSSHSTEKQYPCPLRRFGLCKMAIARPDNACDHFKTHLKTKRKGQRNKDVDWDTMETAILSEYPADKANKLLTNLRKWKQSQNK